MSSSHRSRRSRASPRPATRWTRPPAPIRSGSRARRRRRRRVRHAMLNAAVIGLGWWGQRLVQSAQGSRQISFSRAVTLEPEQARDFAAANGLAVGTSIDEVLADPSIQAVVLATPHTRHRAQVEAAAAARKHIYCEKPFALAKADAQAMLDACARAGVTIAVGHHFRLMPSMKALRAKIATGAFGTIMHAEGQCLVEAPRAAARDRRHHGRTGRVCQWRDRDAGDDDQDAVHLATCGLWRERLGRERERDATG